MLSFGDSERHILSLFSCGSSFSYRGDTYRIILSGKPTVPKGEPKTDIYALAKNDAGQQCEFKISYKQPNADFLENKITAERAKQIFGSDWASIITNATRTLQQKFYRKCLIYRESYGRTEAGSITLGWKFEFVNKTGGDLSGVIPLSTAQKIDIYRGTNLALDKKNAIVNNTVIRNSGVADFIIMENNVPSLQRAIDLLIPIDNYADNSNIFFACKALNYRSFEGKWDGDRPLAVYVNWYVYENNIGCDIIFDSPLMKKGNEVAANLCGVLHEIGITSAAEINYGNLWDYSMVYP